MKVIILAGGRGTRLWPLSRNNFPKPFLRLNGALSLLQETLARFLKRGLIDDLLIVGSHDHRSLFLQQLEEMDGRLLSKLLLEPCGKSSCPAVLYALKYLKSDEPLLVVPSDHRVQPEEAFFDALEEAKKLVDHHVIFGVEPSCPETGYGYLKREGTNVVAFHEKPKREVAAELIEQGYLWNAGIFLLQPKLFCEELAELSPELAPYLSLSFEELQGRYAELPEISVDHALLERSKRVAAVPLKCSWSDLGTWDSLYDHLDKDLAQNVSQGKTELVETKNTLLVGGKRLITTVGIEDLYIVDSDDALLIGKRGSSQMVKELTQLLTQQNQIEVQEHRTAFRPWGSYTVLSEAPGFKVKMIEVIPGGRLSLQWHRHRSEHWVVVCGKATVTLNGARFSLKPNESTYIPMSAVHRLENEGSEPLKLIEVQVGSYLGEDDIVRLDDCYGRGSEIAPQEERAQEKVEEENRVAVEGGVSRSAEEIEAKT